MATSAKTLDVQELESRVKEMYREVAEHPERESTSRRAGSSPNGSATRRRSSTRSRPRRSTRSLADGGNAVGEPVQREGLTVIPIAKARFGFGGGGGSGSREGTRA